MVKDVDDAAAADNEWQPFGLSDDFGAGARGRRCRLLLGQRSWCREARTRELRLEVLDDVERKTVNIAAPPYLDDGVREIRWVVCDADESIGLTNKESVEPARQVL